VYHPFSQGKAIPADARERLDSFTVSGDEFGRMVIDKELEYSRFIYNGGHGNCIIRVHSHKINRATGHSEANIKMNAITTDSKLLLIKVYIRSMK
jgi:hypothetical protein